MILTFFTKDSAVPPHPAYAFDTHEIMLPTTNNRNGNDCRNCISETASCFLSMGFTYSIYTNLEKHPFDTKFPIFIKQESLAHIVRIPRSMLVGNFVASLYNGLVQMGFASG